MGRNTFPPAPSFDTTLHFNGGKETGHNTAGKPWNGMPARMGPMPRLMRVESACFESILNQGHTSPR